MSLFCLAIVMVAWLANWKWANSLCRSWGIDGAIDRVVLAAIVPAAALLAAVHLLALVALFFTVPVVTIGGTTTLFCLIVLCLALFKSFSSPARKLTSDAGSPPDSSHAGLRSPLRWSIAIVAGTYALFCIEALTRFPTGYDGLKYHLPVAVSWVRTGKLDLVLGDIYYSLPENGMVVPFLLASAGLERALSVFNIPNGLVVLGCVYSLARAIGAGSAGAVAATCVAGSIPLVLFQTFSSYIDVYGAAAWMSALLAMVWAWRVHELRARRGLLILAGLAAGIALGSKSTYLVHVALLVPIAGWIGHTAHARLNLEAMASPCHNMARAARIEAIHAVGLFGLALMVCSSFWFIRAGVQTGNPFYPFGITIGGTEILAGFNASDHVPSRSWSRKLAMWLAYPWRETNYAGTGYDYGVNNGLGAAYCALVPAAILFVMLRGWGVGGGQGRGSWIRIFLLLTMCAPILVMTAFTEVLRYTFPLLLVGVVLAAPLVDRLHGVFPVATRRMLTVALGVTCVIALLAPARALAGKWRDGSWERDWQYQIPTVVNEWPMGSRVLYVGPPDLIYPFMGANFRHEVIHENVWRARYGNGAVDQAALERAGIDLVILRDEWPADWGHGPPGELIFDDTHQRTLTTTVVTKVYGRSTRDPRRHADAERRATNEQCRHIATEP